MIKLLKTIGGVLAGLGVLVISAIVGLATVIGVAIMQLAGLGLLIVGGIAVVINEWRLDRKENQKRQAKQRLRDSDIIDQ